MVRGRTGARIACFRGDRREHTPRTTSSTRRTRRGQLHVAKGRQREGMRAAATGTAPPLKAVPHEAVGHPTLPFIQIPSL